ncbi:hypothetical protein HMPREF0868_0169 [Mageeibacillus indolicus UPII9-5]|uniref:Uncharacterized protein n=1 Tax=Mageeibacillus indolicus (strain UPII9-5) TaxID=699246 RepID=D3R005_MAGIU|nr:hypothetical protein [Mageeibacillus indolicus]ADC91285.1 hypothetical protein HMPREF0868_0169 [Mageeibacillus indolicus UPII9-5]
MPKIETLVDEGFRVSLIETAFFDGKFEIPHIRWGDERTYSNELLGEKVAFQGVDKNSIVSIVSKLLIMTANK